MKCCPQLLFLILAFFFSSLSCSLDEQKSLFKEFEENWESCYEEQFHFQKDESVGGSDYIKCKLGKEDVLINKYSSNYDSHIYYSYTSFVPDTMVMLPGNEIQGLSLLVSFIALENLTGFYIEFKYPKDSLNYTIQKLFSQNTLSCSTSFIDKDVEFYVATFCQPNGRIRFSTFHSTDSDQHIQIDEFTFTKQNGYWHYKLKYSTNQLTLTNERWNSNTMTDIFGRQLKSNVLVENIPVENLSAQISFSIEEGK